MKKEEEKAICCQCGLEKDSREDLEKYGDIPISERIPWTIMKGDYFCPECSYYLYFIEKHNKEA